MKPDEIAKCIPKEVLLAVAGAMSKRQSTRAAVAAGLAAWPGAEQTELCGGRSGPALILPLSQERAADLNEGDDELLWRRD
jgi:hypothetical protein